MLGDREYIEDDLLQFEKVRYLNSETIAVSFADSPELIYEYNLDSRKHDEAKLSAS